MMKRNLLRRGTMLATAMAALVLLAASALTFTPTALGQSETAPAPVQSVSLTRADGAVTANWNAPVGAAKYHVTYSTDGGASWHAPVNGHTNVTTAGLTFNADNAKSYVVGVRAGNPHGWSGWVNSPSIGPYNPPKPTPTPEPTPTPTPEPAPALAATRGNDGDAASVSWTAYTGDDFRYYRVIVCDDSQYDGSSCSGTVYKSDAIADANDTGPVAVTGLNPGLGYGVILQTWRAGGALKSHAAISALPVTINLENVTATVATVNVGNWNGQYYYRAENNSAGGASGAGGASAAGSSAGNCHGSGNGGTGSISGLQPGADYTVSIYSNSNCNGAAMASAQAQTEISSQQPSGAGECTYFYDRDGNNGQGDFGYSGDYTLTGGWGGYLRNYRETAFTRWVDPNNHASDDVDASCYTGDGWVRVNWAPDANGDGKANDPVTITWKNRQASNWICDRRTGISPPQGDANECPSTVTNRKYPAGGPPDDIASVSVVRSSGALSLSWTAPATVGNAPITGYKSSCSTNGGYDHSYSACGGNIGAAATSHTITGVDNNLTYVVALRPLSAAGISEWTESAFSAPFTPATVSVSNLAKSDHSTACDVSGNSACAVSFTTGGANTVLGSVEAKFKAKTGSPGNIQVTLHADNSGNPSSVVRATLSGSNPDTAGNRTYTCAGAGCALDAGATYFVRFQATSGDYRNDSYNWVTTLSDDQDPTPAGNGWSLADGLNLQTDGGTWTPFPDSGKLKVSATTGARLDASAVTGTTATPTLLNHPADWWYQRTAPTGDNTCHSITAGVNTVSLSNLNNSTSYTYKAYDRAGCASADEIGSASFTTPASTLTASSVTATGVTLTLGGSHTGNWHYRADTTPYTSCSIAPTASNVSVSLTGLSPGASYTFKAYSDSTCSTEIVAAPAFTTLGVSVSNLNYPNQNTTCNIGSNLFCAVGFTTGSANSSYTLSDVVALFDAQLNNPRDIQVTLHTESNGVPNSATLATLSGSNPRTAGEYQYRCAGSGCALSASTTYFIQFKTASGGGGYNLHWTDTDDQVPTPASNGWSLADKTHFSAGYWIERTDTAKVKVAAAPGQILLTASAVPATGGTLTLAGHTGDWYYKADAAPYTSCSTAQSGSAVSLAGLSVGASYTFKAYSDSNCSTEIAAAPAFTTPTPTLTASNLTGTGATLTLIGHTGDWYYQYTTPSGGTCSGAGSGSSTTVTMGAGSYTFAAYGDASCTNLLATTIAFSKDTKPAAPSSPTAVATANKELSTGWQQPLWATKYHVTYTCNNGVGWGLVANGSVDSEGNLSQTGQTVTATVDLSAGWWNNQSPACRMALRAGNDNGWSSWVNSNSVTPQ